MSLKKTFTEAIGLIAPILARYDNELSDEVIDISNRLVALSERSNTRHDQGLLAVGLQGALNNIARDIYDEIKAPGCCKTEKVGIYINHLAKFENSFAVPTQEEKKEIINKVPALANRLNNVVGSAVELVSLKIQFRDVMERLADNFVGPIFQDQMIEREEVEYSESIQQDNPIQRSRLEQLKSKLKGTLPSPKLKQTKPVHSPAEARGAALTLH